MIVFDLRCGTGGHVFEAWFGSSGDYEDQRGRGLLLCPICGDTSVDKAVMAPRVGAKGNRGAGGEVALSSDPEGVKTMLAAVAAAQKKLLESSDFVGDRFAEEARAIHAGERETRSIHGRATREEVASLAEEGVAIAPLPLPVLPPGSEN